MNKNEFLSLLNKKLEKFPKQEVKERRVFYSEMIDDRVEEGLTEDEAVSEIGDIDEIVKQIAIEMVDKEIVKEPLNKWELILLIVGSPIWFPLLLVAFVVVWSLLISLWVIELPFFIFSYISKYLFIGCKESSKWVAKISKNTLLKIENVFKK